MASASFMASASARICAARATWPVLWVPCEHGPASSLGERLVLSNDSVTLWEQSELWSKRHSGAFPRYKQPIRLSPRWSARDCVDIAEAAGGNFNDRNADERLAGKPNEKGLHGIVVTGDQAMESGEMMTISRPSSVLDGCWMRIIGMPMQKRAQESVMTRRRQYDQGG